MSNIGFNDLPIEEQAYIEIEDDGYGMSLDIIKNVWLRPATPNKFDKKNNKIFKTPKGRITQGEKGIGRFAIHKLGEKIELYSKSEENFEVKLEMNFIDYDPDETNILITHTPAYGILDKDIFGNNIGSRSLLERMNNLPNLRYHIFGHIHESAGKYVDYEKQRVYINASLLNEQYKLVRMPYAFIYKK